MTIIIIIIVVIITIIIMVIMSTIHVQADAELWQSWRVNNVAE